MGKSSRNLSFFSVTKPNPTINRNSPSVIMNSLNELSDIQVTHNRNKTLLYENPDGIIPAPAVAAPSHQRQDSICNVGNLPDRTPIFAQRRIDDKRRLMVNQQLNWQNELNFGTINKFK
jgi:hypothetical protein